MSCRPSRPTPPPYPNSWPKNRCVVAMKLPDGRQASGCSKPGVVSTVDCSTASLLYTRMVLRHLAIDGLGAPVQLCHAGGQGVREVTQTIWIKRAECKESRITPPADTCPAVVIWTASWWCCRLVCCCGSGFPERSVELSRFRAPVDVYLCIYSRVSTHSFPKRYLTVPSPNSLGRRSVSRITSKSLDISTSFPSTEEP